MFAALLCVAAAHLALAEDIAGSGSTFAYPVMAKWVKAYQQATGTSVVFQPTGSGAGITEVRSGIVSFAISDAPLVDAQLLRDGLSQFPVVIGAIVPVINLDGVTSGQLHLTPDVLADIYLGKITRWRDPAIAQLNPGLTLPDLAVTVLYRSDPSGTTFNFTDYLSKINTRWLAAVGSDLTVHWPLGFGGKGNGGIAENIARVKGSIGYLEYTYAVRAKISYALIRNRAGNYVTPTERSFHSAVAGVDWLKEPDFHVLLTDSDASDAWPIMATSFALVRTYPQDLDKARASLAFFRWALEHGQDSARALYYLPLPTDLVDQVEAYWALQLPRN
jgi:phosphate transport system substrate-binding protein